MNKYSKYRSKSKAFTLVEVLICVGIIGIIAAITIPALLSSTSEKALEAQRKALYSRMAQAFGQIKNLKNYEQSTSSGSGASITYTDTGSGLNFVTQALATVYKISNSCDSSSLRECSIPTSVNDYYSETSSTSFTLTDKTNLQLLNPNTENSLDGLKADFAAFKTVNGESILMWYNPRCKSKSEVSPHNLAESVCINMIYDVNGKNTVPNAYGEDIGYITVFYPSDPVVVAPVLYHEEAGGSFSGTHSEMLAKATELDLVPPTLEELTSILINANLTQITKDKIDSNNYYWSSSYTTDGSGKLWTAGQKGVQTQDPSTSLPYFLVKK